MLTEVFPLYIADIKYASTEGKVEVITNTKKTVKATWLYREDGESGRWVYKGTFKEVEFEPTHFFPNGLPFLEENTLT
jgi:hypothetical protein